MNEKVMVSPEIQTEAVVLPQIVSIKQASQRMGLPEYYIRRLCREVPGMAFQSGIKWYINLGKMADYFNGGTTTLGFVKDAGVNCDILKINRPNCYTHRDRDNHHTERTVNIWHRLNCENPKRSLVIINSSQMFW